MVDPKYNRVKIKNKKSEDYWMSEKAKGDNMSDGFIWLCSSNIKGSSCNFEIFVDKTENEEDPLGGQPYVTETVRIRKLLDDGGAWIDWNNSHKHLGFYPASGNFKMHWDQWKSSFKLSKNGYYIYNSKQANRDNFYVKVGSDDVTEATSFCLV
jgi:hypothetical protein